MGILEIDEERYRCDPYEERGREVEMPNGHFQIVVMPKYDWDYMDWLVSLGADFQEILKICDETYAEFDLHADMSKKLRWWLNEAYWLREDQGLSQPKWLKG